MNLTSLFLTLLMPPASAALLGRKSQAVNTHHILFSYIKLVFHKFYCHQILALQDLVKISADSAFSDSDSNYNLCDSMNYNLLPQLIGNTTPSSFYFALFVPFHVEDAGYEQHLTKKLFARTILQKWGKAHSVLLV